MEILPERQEEVFWFISEFMDKNGYSPTIREIMEGVVSRSTSPIHWVLSQLREKGYITWDPRKARTIRILKTPSPSSRSRTKI